MSLSFNPRLTSAARRTVHCTSGACKLISFNPRLTSAARRTLFDLFRLMLHKVSIRASLQQRGERNYDVANVGMIVFQSAPHFSSEANLFGNATASAPLQFQSAPHFSSEANNSIDKIRLDDCGFNPRLTSAARRTRARAGFVAVL